VTFSKKQLPKGTIELTPWSDADFFPEKVSIHQNVSNCLALQAFWLQKINVTNNTKDLVKFEFFFFRNVFFWTRALGV